MDFDLYQQQKSAPSAPPDASKRAASGLDAVYDFFQGFVTGGGAQAGPLGGGLNAARFNLPWASAFMGGATGTPAAPVPASSTTEGTWPSGAVAASSYGGGSAASRGMVPQPGQFDNHPFEEPVEAMAPWNDEGLYQELYQEPLERSPAPWTDEGIREEPMVSGLDPRWGLEVEDDAPRGVTSPLPTADGRGGLTPQRSLSPARSSGRSPRGATPLRNGHSSAQGPYEADQEDLLDQHVAYYLRHHPDVHAKHLIFRKRPGTYQVDDREVRVEWQYASEPGGQGFLVALDGPLRQPFADYMEMSENNAEWDSSMGRSSLSMIPRDKRMSFHDQHKVYTRLEAMKVAKEQALVREKHADYVKDGKEAPTDLMQMYKKSIQQKLGQRQRHSHTTPPAPPPPPPPEFPGDPSTGAGSGRPSTGAGSGRPRGPGGPGGPGDYGGPGGPGGAPGHYTPPPAGGPPPGAYPPWSGGGPGTSRQQPGLMPPNLFGPPSLGPTGGWGPVNYGGGPGYNSRWPG
mmetsp:Transcript_136222/g.240133  ORF Transcript_136222/g.240133 Transcript_136222/m.240133 type:complete len:515 (+) Transcript_136222:136-1680(+)